MKKLGPAQKALHKTNICALTAERKSEPKYTPALLVVSPVVAPVATAFDALENAFKLARSGADHFVRAAAKKEPFRVQHLGYCFSGQQALTAEPPGKPWQPDDPQH